MSPTDVLRSDGGGCRRRLVAHGRPRPRGAAPNAPVTLTQPNGLVLRCLVSGDEYLNWIRRGRLHDSPDPNTGYYTYAVLEDGVPRDHST